jgi:hypothetical protein
MLLRAREGADEMPGGIDFTGDDKDGAKSTEDDYNRRD